MSSKTAYQKIFMAEKYDDQIAAWAAYEVRRAAELDAPDVMDPEQVLMLKEALAAGTPAEEIEEELKRIPLTLLQEPQQQPPRFQRVRCVRRWTRDPRESKVFEARRCANRRPVSSSR